MILIFVYPVESSSVHSDQNDLDPFVDAQGLIHFKDDPAWTDEVIFGSSRPYHLFVLATTLDARYKCDVCQEFQSEYHLLSASYQHALTEPQDLHRGTYDSLPVYFTVADYQWNPAVFKKFGLTSAPHLVYMPPSSLSTDEETQTFLLPEEHIYSRFQSDQNLGKAEELLVQFIGPRSGLSFRLRQPLFQTIVLVGQLMIVVLALGYFSMRHGRRMYEKLGQNKYVWMSVSTLCYALSVSGMVFCVIRNPPLAAQGRKGEAVYISSEPRSQYVLEGLLIGAMNVLMAASLLVVSQYTMYLPPSVLKTTLTTALVFTFYFTWSIIRSLYTFKNAWYAGF